MGDNVNDGDANAPRSDVDERQWANEEFGVPATKDGIRQDPNNHNGPKPGDSSGPAKDAQGGLNSAEIEDGEAYEQADRVEKAKASDKAETPESPRQRGSAASSAKPETR